MTRDQASLIDLDDALHRHRERLTEIYEPATDREAMLIDELAHAYQEKEAFDHDHRLWIEHETEFAHYNFQKQAAEDFMKLQRQWPKAPAVVAPLVGQSLNGVAWLVNLWQIIVARLAPQAIGPGPGMDHACQALLALGFSDKIQNLAEPGWWWATRFLAIQADPDAAIAAWLRKSASCDKPTEMQQARHKLSHAPDPTTARWELYDEALRQAAHWSEQLTILQAAEPARQEAQLAQARCMGLKSPGLATALNNAFKLRDSIHKSIKFIEDRLARLHKEQAATQRYQKRMNRLQDQLEQDLMPQLAATEHPNTRTMTTHPPQTQPYRPTYNNAKNQVLDDALKAKRRMDQIAAHIRT
jgi:hypothetical protein